MTAVQALTDTLTTLKVREKSLAHLRDGEVKGQEYNRLDSKLEGLRLAIGVVERDLQMARANEREEANAGKPCGLCNGQGKRLVVWPPGSGTRLIECCDCNGKGKL